MKTLVDIKILGGLPVTVEARIEGPDPETGIFKKWVDDWNIVAVNGKLVKNANWLYKRIDKNENDIIVGNILDEIERE